MLAENHILMLLFASSIQIALLISNDLTSDR